MGNPQMQQTQQIWNIDRTKFKTELCKNWVEQGYCRYGKRCQFAHGNLDVKDKNQPTNDLYKSRTCKSFHKRKIAHCLYGNRCQFRHEDRQFNEIKNYFHVLKLMVLTSLNRFKQPFEKPDVLTIAGSKLLERPRLAVFQKLTDDIEDMGEQNP